MNKKVFPIILLGLIGCIGFFSINDSVLNLGFGENNGEQHGEIRFEKKVSEFIGWSFESTQPVKLTIYKTSTLEYLTHVCEDIEENFPGSNPWYIIEDFFTESIVSEGLYEDLGTYHCLSPGYYTIIIYTSGHLSYHLKYDPYSIDLLVISYGLLIFTTTIALIYYLSKSYKLVKGNKVTNHKRANQGEAQTVRNSSNVIYCSQCGTQSEPDSIFCHECGHELT